MMEIQEEEISQNFPKTIFVRSCHDLVLTEDRVLENLLVSEREYHSRAGDHMALVQQNMMKEHRKVLTDWMLEVCQVHRSSSQVFLSSVHYLDVFLSQISLKSSQLQLLASACLSIASKLHDPQPPSLTDFVIMTDCSITIKELQSMELLVLTKLRWELSAPTSLQFLSILLAKMEDLLSQPTAPSIQKEAETFLMLAATEHKFQNVKPSVLACVSIMTAGNSLAASDLLSRLVNISPTVLCQILAQFKLSVSSWIKIAGVSNNNQQLELAKPERCQNSEMMEIS